MFIGSKSEGDWLELGFLGFGALLPSRSMPVYFYSCFFASYCIICRFFTKFEVRLHWGNSIFLMDLEEMYSSCWIWDRTVGGKQFYCSALRKGLAILNYHSRISLDMRTRRESLLEFRLAP